MLTGWDSLKLLPQSILVQVALDPDLSGSLLIH